MTLLLTITEVGMLSYWVIAIASAMEVIHIPAEYMYSDHLNPLVVAWNWSFFPVDFGFAVLGLTSRYGRVSAEAAARMRVVGLTLMFCAGLMAVSFWAILGEFDLFWWGVNIWLIALSTTALLKRTDI